MPPESQQQQKQASKRPHSMCAGRQALPASPADLGCRKLDAGKALRPQAALGLHTGRGPYEEDASPDTGHILPLGPNCSRDKTLNRQTEYVH